MNKAQLSVRITILLPIIINYHDNTMSKAHYLGRPISTVNTYTATFLQNNRQHNNCLQNITTDQYAHVPGDASLTASYATHAPFQQKSGLPRAQTIAPRSPHQTIYKTLHSHSVHLNLFMRYTVTSPYSPPLLLQCSTLACYTAEYDNI
jgi:hypothetical protein